MVPIFGRAGCRHDRRPGCLSPWCFGWAVGTCQTSTRPLSDRRRARPTVRSTRATF